MKNRSKLFLAVPVVAGMLMFSCKSPDDYETKETATVDTENNAPFNLNSNRSGGNPTTAAGDQTTLAKKGKVSSDLKSDAVNNTAALPQYPGGQTALDKFITDNIEYPAAAFDAGIEGTVTVELAFDKTGKIYTQRLSSDQLGYGLDEAVMKAIKKMPMWTPGTIKGEKVKTHYNLPIRFQIAG